MTKVTQQAQIKKAKNTEKLFLCNSCFPKIHTKPQNVDLLISKVINSFSSINEMSWLSRNDKTKNQNV